MKISYDKKGDTFLIKFKKAFVKRDVEIAPNVFAGYAEDGSLVEIQVIDYSESREKEWFNLQAAAAMLGVSERTLQRRIDEGVIKPRKVGREYHITAEDLERLEKTQ